MEHRKKILWIVPEVKGGIRSYADTLWPVLMEVVAKSKYASSIELVESSLGPGDSSIDLIHIQHEFGLFGSKLPFLNTFSAFIKQLRYKYPNAKIIATAHTVLDENYKYSWKNRGWQSLFRLLGNYFLVPFLRKSWTKGTWSLLDGVVVHASRQKTIVTRSGCQNVWVIPHFVPNSVFKNVVTLNNIVLVFGYFSPEKGQDIAIQAWNLFQKSGGQGKLILAGGVRRKQDQRYFNYCKKLIKKYNLSDSITITGYVENSKIDAIYNEASLVLVPFRETFGSGSLAQALARGKVILASDLPLNRDIEQVDHDSTGCLSFFKASDPSDCAHQIKTLLEQPDLQKKQSLAAQSYAKNNNPQKIAEMHAELYVSL